MKHVQLEHDQIIHDNVKHPITVVLDNVELGVNVGSIFRICDGMGAEQLYLCGRTPSPDDKNVRKSSRSTEKSVIYLQKDNTLEAIQELKKQNYKIVALELTSNSVSIENYSFFENNAKVAIIVGNEKHGISSDVLDNVDAAVHINMYGQNTSLNVSTALSIALYEALIQSKKEVNVNVR